MVEFLIMLKNVLIFIALAVPSYVLTKKKILKGEDCTALSQLLLYVAVPFLVFCSVLDITLTGKTALEFLLVGVLTASGQILCCLLTKFLPGMRNHDQEENVMRFSMVFGNNGFLGLPLISALFAETMPLTVAYFVIISIVTNLLILAAGDRMIAGKKANFSPKALLSNSILIAFVLGIAANLLQLGQKFPEMVTYATYMKNMVTPVSMCVIGIKFGQMQVGQLFCDKRLYCVSFVRLVLFPALVAAVLLLAGLFLTIPEPLILALFIGFAMPTATITTSLAVKYNVPGNGATIYVLGTTLFSVVSLPVMYSLLQLVL